MSKALPNFLIVGAAKAGTSSLYNYLNQHPDVFMPAFKEPQFFVIEELKDRLRGRFVDNWEGYTTLFKDAQSYRSRGEASVFYLYYYHTAINNIIKYLGTDTKIIILLRDPVQRAFSAYNHTLKNNPDENLDSFESALDAEDERMAQPHVSPMLFYKSMGFYYDSVKAYKENFENVLVLDNNEMIKNPQVMFDKIFGFLGIEPYQIDTSNVYNKGGMVWKSAMLKNLTKTPLGKKLLKALPRPLYNNIKNKMFKPITQKITDKATNDLRDYYRQDIEKLVTLENQFEYWLKK